MALSPLTWFETPLGYRKDGRPIYAILGGAEDPPADPPKDKSGDKPPADPPKDIPKADGVNTFSKEYVESLRTEAGNHRAAKTKAESDAKEAIKNALKALGVDPTADPAEVAKQREAERDALADGLRTERVSRALDKAARKAGADEDLLDAVLNRNGALKDLDPTSSDFATKLEGIVQDALKGNPKLKVQGAGTSGSEFAGGTGEQTGKITEAQLAKMSEAEIVKAHKEGKLDHLL